LTVSFFHSVRERVRLMKHPNNYKRLAGVAIAAALMLTTLSGGVTSAGRPGFALHTIHADDQALRVAAAAGAAAIVQLFEWRLIEPQPGEYHWEYADFIVRACEYYRLALLMRLDHPPDWAVQVNADPSLPADLDAFAAFVGRVAERYQGRVHAYIIWNEPNLALEWNRQAPNPEGYARLLTRAGTSIKAADAQAIVVGAGLAPTNQNDIEAMDDLIYLRRLLDAVEGQPFDALAAHPYGFGLPPAAPADANQGLNARRLTRLHQVLADAGYGDTPIWITEMGWTTSTPPGATQGAVTPAQQAVYLLQSFDMARTEWPWVEWLTVWHLSVGLPPDDEKAGYSIVHGDYRPRPAYAALARRFGAQSLRERIATWWKVQGQPDAPIEILAPDVVIRLGERDTFYPHWARIYGGQAPAREWAGTFYVDQPGQGAWNLTMEIMQVEEPGNLVRINGQAIDPPAIPLRGRPDYSSVWTSVSMRIPATLLRRGANEIQVRASPRLPVYQFVRYESMQFRNLQLTPD
jgi:polysaccharide biosynthesis protein PslG